MITVSAGLAQVEVGESAISLVEGDMGRLSYRGIPIETLVEWNFLKVAYLVITAEHASANNLCAFETSLHQSARLNREEVELISMLAKLTYMHPMQVLQSITPALDTRSALEIFPSFEPELARGMMLAAKLPNSIALLRNLRMQIWSGNSAQLIQYLAATNDETNLNNQFLSHLNAGPVLATQTEAFRACQILQLEHSFNASTFAARVVSSTLPPVANVLAAAFGTLHGPLHGGADQAALQTAEKVGSPDKAAAFVDQCLANGEKVMGMGHREYKIVDPRAIFLKDCARELSKDTPYQVTFETLQAIEKRFTERMQDKGKDLYANLEFYKGIVYRVIGLGPEYFTCGFAMARVYGYLAHFSESRINNTLIRPSVKYTGPVP